MAKNDEKKNEMVAQGTALPAFLQDQMDSCDGNENVTVEDLLLPRVEVVQALSPQIEEDSPKFIPDLKQGDLFNNLTGEIYGRELLFIPVLFKKEWLLFQDRKLGGAFGGSYASEAEAQEMPPSMEGDGWEVKQADVNYVLLLNAEHQVIGQAAISMTKTKIKVAKKLNTLIMMGKGPRYSAIYRLNTVKETNPKGTFYNYDVARVGYIQSEGLFNEARAAYEIMSAGVSTDYSDAETGTAASPDDGEF